MTSFEEQQQQNLQNQNYVEENSQPRSNKISFSANDAKNESSKSSQQMLEDGRVRYNLVYPRKSNESFQEHSLVPQQDVILSQQSPNFNFGGPQQDVILSQQSPNFNSGGLQQDVPSPSYNIRPNYNIKVPSHIKEPYFLEGSIQNQVIDSMNASTSFQKTSPNLKLQSKEQFQNYAFHDGMNHSLNPLEFNQQVRVENLNNLKMTSEPIGQIPPQFQTNKGKSPLSLSIPKENQQKNSPLSQYMSQNPPQFQGQDPMINMNVASNNDHSNNYEKPIFSKSFEQGFDITKVSLQDTNASQHNSQNDDFKNLHLSTKSTSKYLESSSPCEKMYNVVLSNLRWIQKLIIIPSKQGGCHDITSTVMIIGIEFCLIT